MKNGMTAIKKVQVKDRWVWLAENYKSDEWATYVSFVDDPKEVMWGHYYMDAYCTALDDFYERVKLYS